MQNSESMGSGGTLAHDLLRPTALNGRRRRRTVPVFVVSPFRVPIEGKGLLDSVVFGFAKFRRGWNELGTTCK